MIQKSAEKSTFCIKLPADLCTIATKYLLLTSSANDYVECDKRVVTSSDITTNDIVGNSIIEGETDNCESEDDDAVCPTSTNDCVVRSKEALSNINTLKKYLFQQYNVPETFYRILKTLVQKMELR